MYDGQYGWKIIAPSNYRPMYVTIEPGLQTSRLLLDFLLSNPEALATAQAAAIEREKGKC